MTASATAEQPEPPRLTSTVPERHVAAMSLAPAGVLPTAFVVPGAVTLYPDGRVVLADGIDVDTAAARFWDAVRAVAGWKEPGADDR